MTDNTKVRSKSEEEDIDKTPDDTGSESDVDVDNQDTEGKMIPKSRLDKTIEQREAYKAELETTKEELSSIKDEIASLKELVTKTETKDSPTFTQEEESALEKIDKGLKQRGYMTRAEVEEMERIKSRNSEIVRLQSTYKKGTGFPPFEADKVMVYAKQKGFGDNLEAAYRDLHWEAISTAIAKGQSPNMEPPDSEKPTGSNQTVPVGITREKIAEMDVSEWNQKGASIMDKFKKSIFGK
jgi:hypothetical protein